MFGITHLQMMEYSLVISMQIGLTFAWIGYALDIFFDKKTGRTSKILEFIICVIFYIIVSAVVWTQIIQNPNLF